MASEMVRLESTTERMKLNCHHYSSGNCHSCQWLEKPYAEQLTDKEAELKRLILPFTLQNTQILPSVSSALVQFRNKAKMVVSGSVERPILGLLKDNQDPTSGNFPYS